MTPVQRQFESLRSLGNLFRGRVAARLWAMRGAHVGAKCAIGRRCIVDRPWGVELGQRVLLEADVYLKIVADTASLRIGDHVFVGRGVEFDVLGHIEVGAHAVIAPHCFITDHNHGTRAGARIDEQACAAKPVAIGADVWLGTGVVVLPGVTIGDGAVIGAHSVVTRDIEPMTVCAGTPARFLRRRTSDGMGESGN
jgi:acetyltransferase-like isoleucine patch superfamily enzyme